VLANLYRDGNDSVAWHGDNIGRSRTEDTMVAIVGLGATRVFALRPRGGGPSPEPGSRRHRTLRLRHNHGDLLVMGGACQRTWEHSIPKTARPTGPRISIQFRPYDVR
jgi:alkylated DNA repair dioxygenase AlkB